MATRRRKRLSNTGAITKLGDRWRTRWRTEGKRHSAMFATRQQAEAFLAARVMDLARELRPN
jgi:hypothetical protein